MKKMAVMGAILLPLLVQGQQTEDSAGKLSEVVIRGNAKAVGRGDQVIATEIISQEFFRKNPTANLLEAVTMLNGVRPQLNCSVCNTGDIHLNGMEGPYTMVLIDGMPIVSSLSTVYGFSGIPNSIIERVEIVKGPAGAQYSPEAMGGLINIITKNVNAAPKLNIDMYGTSWLESNMDMATRWKISKKLQTLLSANYYRFQTPTDHNLDGFTDMPLQNRISVFNKWALTRKYRRSTDLALRFLKEDRWGGQTFWEPYMRGTELAYAEQITTRRWECIGQYQWPLKEEIKTQLSYNWHDQNSMYGTTPFVARQQVFFGQTIWQKNIARRHRVLAGISSRHTWYDDNTPATRSADTTKNQPALRSLTGGFIQDEWSALPGLTLSLGYRADYDPVHKWIHSPRFAVKYASKYAHTLRLSAGNGYRVVNVFTEDHAALSGARQVVIAEQLKPERSWGTNVNYLYRFAGGPGNGSIDITAFYNYFYNKIVGDFDSDPQKIIYKNLQGDARSGGISLNADYMLTFPLTLSAGITYMEVTTRSEYQGILQSKPQLFAPKWSGNVLISYTFKKRITLDLTAKWDGSMRLPVVPNDFRPEYSPWMCTANMQVSYKVNDRLTLYGGGKNLLNQTPGNPILRPFDPFDKTINDPVSNPYGYTFDPSYSYASMQGIRGFFGVRYSL